MKTKVLVVAVFSLLVVACGKSEEGTAITETANVDPGAQVATVTESPAEVEATEASEETVAAAKIVSQPPEPTGDTSAGEAVYKKSCMSCHMTGAAGAPKVGDAAAWEARIAKGSAALVQSAISGIPGTAMMARGTCGACSDDDIKVAVEYMIAQSR